uniref:ATP-binding cassette domain-containing protein n=1 Tax=Desulfobacca acetoxidans TaxID=60893 RepID=A0A7C3V0A5_9BACT
MTDNDFLLELRNVNQVYAAGARQFTAIKDFSLTLKEGDFSALLGPSGCGKSTLLRIITGLQPPTRGQVFYRGRPLQGVNPKATIVFQTFALFPWLTVQENVELALEARGLPPRLRLSRTLEILDRVGLDGFENAYPRELSGGMRQKVGFARAIAVEPELLCLDEPFSNLDVLSAETLRGELLELWTSGKLLTKAILMVTHNIEEAVSLADRIVVMEKEPGRLVMDLKVDLAHPRNRKDLEFEELVDRVYALLAGQTQSEQVELGTEPGQPGPTRRLPKIHISELPGLLEYLSRRTDHRHDIYALADDIKVNSDQLLNLIEAAELLGFATVAKGDINLTPLGATFAEASIIDRKEIFAARLRRLPMFRWLMNIFRASEKNRQKWEVVQAALELEFHPEEAQRQLEIAVNWGRYAELLSYDDKSRVIYLEPGAGT